jgi:hypothetical protein
MRDAVVKRRESRRICPAFWDRKAYPWNAGSDRSDGQNISGRGAVWLARLNGVQEVAGSNPVAPTSQGLA